MPASEYRIIKTQVPPVFNTSKRTITLCAEGIEIEAPLGSWLIQQIFEELIFPNMKKILETNP